MDFKNFQHLILKLQTTSERDQEIYKLGVDLINFTDDYHSIIDVLLKTYYSEEGEDIISWWLYEDVEKKIYNKKGEVIEDLTSIESLWEYVEKIKKSKKFKPYIIKDPITPEQRMLILKNFTSTINGNN